MKRILYVLGLALLLTGIYTSCKKDNLEALHEREVETLKKYIKDNNLTEEDNVSGIYIKISEPRSTDTTLIRSKFRVLLQYNIFLIDSTKVFSTEDEYGHTYEEFPFYVDVSNDVVNQSPIQQIAGMHIGLKQMHIGDRALMVIPSELAFKAVDYSSAYRTIPRFSTLLVYVYAKKGYPAPQYQ